MALVDRLFLCSGHSHGVRYASAAGEGSHLMSFFNRVVGNLGGFISKLPQILAAKFRHYLIEIVPLLRVDCRY